MFTMRAIDLRDKRRYFIESRAKRSIIAWFDSLEIAGLVLRFLNGTNLKQNDSDEARAALREYDMRVNGVKPDAVGDHLEGVDFGANHLADTDLDPLRDM